jgi:FkbM family methyltransferase
MDLTDYERLDPRCTVQFEGAVVTYVTPNTHIKWRVDSLFQKEPCTIEWIAGFRRDEVLVDVGANVGMYTIWSAMTRGVRVFAFEPESQNYALLNRNILANGLDERVTAYCLALSDRAGLGELHLSRFQAGGSCHSLNERVDFKHDPMRPAYTQGCVSATLDELVAAGKVPLPDHVKIDVDGFEPQVIDGARRTIREGKVRSLLIEINQNLADHMELVDMLEDWGFRFDPAQVARVERRSGMFKGCAEYVFVR